MKMTRTEAVEVIKNRWRDFYQKDKRRGIICPLCKSGSGPNGSGISEYKKGKGHFLKCWNGACEFKDGGSIIDLYMLDHRIDDFNEAVDEMAALLSIEIEPAEGGNTTFRSRRKEQLAADPEGTANKEGEPERMEQNSMKEEARQEEMKTAAPAEAVQRDFSGYYIQSVQRLEKSPEAIEYLSRRGISITTAIRYYLGFDPAWISPTVVERLQSEGNSWRPQGTPRIIIPSAKTHYVARDIRPDEQIPEKARSYKKMNEGSPEIFGLNIARNSGARNIFITEGAFDALSIVEAGQTAIALNSTSNAEKLAKELAEKPIDANFIICLDNDAAGRKTAEQLRERFRELNIKCTEADINGIYKDPNEHIAADREGFTAVLNQAAARANSDRPDSVLSYIENGGLVEDIERRQKIGVRPTGIKNLDAQIGGGLRPGLILIGAISSLGKTTFCSQLADGVAAAGNDVIYFSLEQNRLEMLSKCLAREAALIDNPDGKILTGYRGITGAQIMDGFRGEKLTKAVEKYISKVGDRISIVEAGENFDSQYMVDYVRDYHNRTGARPVVIVDYLQILNPGELPNGHKQDRRETVDECLRQLVQLKKELDLTIIAIVSLNRANYLQPFDFESIKESGLSEYSADVVWGLQLQCLDEALFQEANKLKEKRERIRGAKGDIPRKIKLVSVKHRGQNAIYECFFDYFPQYDLFVPTDKPADPEQDNKRKAGRRL